jgi:hypothetical protein
MRTRFAVVFFSHRRLSSSSPSSNILLLFNYANGTLVAHDEVAIKIVIVCGWAMHRNVDAGIWSWASNDAQRAVTLYPNPQQSH